MEAIGAASSLIAIVDAALSVTKSSRKLYKDYGNATDSLRSTDMGCLRAQSLIDEFLLLQRTLSSNANTMPTTTGALLSQTVEQMSEALQQLRSAFVPTDHLTVRDRLRWMRNQSTVHLVQQRLEIVKKDLTLILQLLHIHLSLIQRTSLVTVTEAQDALSHQMNRLADLLIQSRNIPQASNEVFQDSRLLSNTKLTQDRAEELSCTSLAISRPCSYGLSVSASMIWNGYQTTYATSLRARLPWWLGQRAMIIELRFRRYLFNWASFTILPSFIGLSNIVARDSPIAQACRLGNEKTVRALFRQRKALPNDRYMKRRGFVIYGTGFHSKPGMGEEITLLGAAIKSGNNSLVRFLVEAGADVNTTFSKRHMSPLQYALQCGHVEISRLLIYNNASLDHVDSENNGLAHYLFSADLGRSQAGRSARAQAAHTLVKLLLNNSYLGFGNLNSNGESVLWKAAVYCLPETASLMIKNGALDIYAPDPRRSLVSPNPLARYQVLTPLNMAIYYNNFYLVPLLLQCGNHASIKGALHLAIKNAPRDVIKTLLSYNANVSEVNTDGQTPLHAAISDLHSEPREESLLELLENNADVNATDSKGRTPLHYAAQNGHYHSSILLLEQGANVCAKDVSRYSPLDLLTLRMTSNHFLKRDWGRILSDLLFYGANPYEVTALPFAQSSRSEDRHWWQNFKGCLRKEEFLKECTECLAMYYKAIHDTYPETVIDGEGDIYWDTHESISGLGYGSSYLFGRHSHIPGMCEECSGRKAAL